MHSFPSIDFYLQLVWIVVYSFEREKTMLATSSFLFKMVLMLHNWAWTITKLLILGGFDMIFQIIFQI